MYLRTTVWNHMDKKPTGRISEKPQRLVVLKRRFPLCLRELFDLYVTSEAEESPEFVCGTGKLFPSSKS